VAVGAPVPSTTAILSAVAGYLSPSGLFAFHFRDCAYDTGGRPARTARLREYPKRSRNKHRSTSDDGRGRAPGGGRSAIVDRTRGQDSRRGAASGCRGAVT